MTKLEESRKYYITHEEMGSTGAAASFTEVTLRNRINHRLVGKSGEYARKTRQPDVSWKADGKLFRAEVKTGCGAVYYSHEGDPTCAENITDDQIFPGMSYVFYWPDGAQWNELDEDDYMDSGYVFTREQFVEMLHQIHKGGKLHVKDCPKRGQIQIQTLKSYNKTTGKWSSKPYDRMMEYIETNDLDTVRWFVEQVLGR